MWAHYVGILRGLPMCLYVRAWTHIVVADIASCLSRSTEDRVIRRRPIEDFRRGQDPSVDIASLFIILGPTKHNIVYQTKDYGLNCCFDYIRAL